MRSFVIACVVAALCGAGVLVAQDGKQDGPPLPKPGKEHELLKQFEGTWTVAGKFLGPDGKWTEGKGAETNSMVGSLWLVIDHKGDMAGMPFHGHGLMGYDPDKKKYVGAWADNFTPSLTAMEGDAADKKLSMTFQSKDCATGKLVNYRQVHEIQDADHHTLTMYCPGPDGKEAVGMILTYTRKK